MSEIQRLLEVFFVVGDLSAARAFYRDVLGLQPYGEADERGSLFLLPGGQLLGLVDRSAATEPNVVAGGRVPAVLRPSAPSSGSAAHLAFAVSDEDLSGWRERLAGHGVAVSGEVAWERGGRSLYFRDPDGRLLELATPGVWDFY